MKEVKLKKAWANRQKEQIKNLLTKVIGHKRVTCQDKWYYICCHNYDNIIENNGIIIPDKKYPLTKAQTKKIEEGLRDIL